MTQGVSRLKELLFEPEAQRLEALTRDLDRQSHSVREAEARLVARLDELNGETNALKSELGARIQQVFDRAGTSDRLERSVALILDGAFREAEVHRHRQLSQAMAPLLVKTIKNEITNSREEMVEALYPITGRLVKAYVANAIKDLMVDINRRLETRLPGRRLALRVKSLLTGRSMAELALAEVQRLEVEELFLIRRGSGELVGHWRRDGLTPNSGHDTMVGGLLSAITSFAETAFANNPGSLRKLDREHDCIYLRASAAYLLAVRCSGTAPAPVEQVVDNELLNTLDRHGTDLAQEPDASPDSARPSAQKVLDGLAGRLELDIAEKHSQLAPSRARFGTLFTMLALILLPLLGLIGWYGYGKLRNEMARQQVRSIIASTHDLNGFPISIDADDQGRSVVISGLVPSFAAKEDLLARIRERLTSAEVTERLSPLPQTAKVDVETPLGVVRSEIASLEHQRATETVLSASSRLTELAKILNAMQEATPRRRDAARFAAAEQSTVTLASDLGRRAGTSGGASSTQELIVGLRDPVARIDAIANDLLPGQPTSMAFSGLESLPRSVDHLSDVVFRLEQIEKNGRLEELRDAMNATPRKLLADWAREHAFFFTNGTDFRNERLAELRLDELARLINAASGIVRIVGYTDERGPQTRNNTLSIQRADKVVAGLVARNVPRDRLVTAGRAATQDMSTAVGETSPNRRVEVHLGFADENAQGP